MFPCNTCCLVAMGKWMIENYLSMPLSRIIPFSSQTIRLVHKVGEDGVYPPAGCKVDSISCYTMDLAICNKEVYLLQQQRRSVAENGPSTRSSARGKWLIDAVDAATEAASMIMDDSIHDNGLATPYDTIPFGEDYVTLAENMTSKYGSFGSSRGVAPPSSPNPNLTSRKNDVPSRVDEEYVEVLPNFTSIPSGVGWSSSIDSDRSTRLVTSDHLVSCFISGSKCVDVLAVLNKCIATWEVRYFCG
jgi:hypothetical protein